MDYTVDSFVRKMVRAVICISVLMMVGGVVAFRSSFAVAFALGVGMTMILNVVKIIWLRYCVTRAVSMASGSGTAFIGIHYILRFVLTGLVLVAAHFIPFTDMFGAVVGLLSLPFANYVVHFFTRRGGPSDTQLPDDSENIEEEPTP